MTIVTNDNNPKCVRIILLLYIYIFIYIYNSNFLLTHKIVFVILSYCHNCHTNACMPQGEIHSSCLQKTRNQHPEKYVSLPAKDSFPPAGSKQEKKLSRLTDFYTLAPPAVLHFPQKAVSLYQQTRELEARFSSRPIRKPVPSPSTSLPESFRKLETDRHFCLTKKTG